MPLQLAAVTLQRRSEIAGMRWSENRPDALPMDNPSRQDESKRIHLLPLSDLVMSFLDQCEGQGEFVFMSPRKGDDEPIYLDPGAISRAMNRMLEGLEMERETPHDLRRTGATNLTSERLGFPRFIVS
ncbi:tyrosine-type recombinase/integrase [Fulvimarina sp. MAC3]|uniref:tyrosine-type recombinase/integrase n=1 Tax=Fulvimarina sp. MAC3 TaxID=3148887 RepID=UPI0031FC4A2C